MKNNLILSRQLPFLLLLLLIPAHFIFIKMNQWQLPNAYIQKPAVIQGVIDSIPEKKFHGVRFQFHTEEFNGKKISTHFLMSWYQHSPPLQIGQHWQLHVKLKPPIGSHNPGGFDYEEFLLSQGITATGYVMPHHNQLITVNHGYFLDHFRQKIQKEIRNAVYHPALAAFISALSVGLRDGLTESDWQVFQKTGTNHLVAIAGLHIGFVFATIYFLAKFLVRFFPRFLLIIPASRFAEINALIGALTYAALSGFAIPAERASIMLFFFMISQLFYRKMSTWRRLFFAGGIILILNPYDLMNSGFWLSFSSMAVLAWVMGGRLRSPKKLILWGKMQGSIIIGLLPLMLFFFQQASLIAFLTNAVAIPCVGFVILPMCLLATGLYFFKLHLLSHDLFFLTGKLLWPLWKFLTDASHLSFSSWHHAVSNLWILIIGIISALFLLAPRGFSAKWFGCFGLLPLFFYHPAHPKIGDFRVTIIDVGQGLSVLVQTAHHVMLYDTGAHFPGGFDYGESVVAPYLRDQGISTINRLEISHGDNDHSGGADAIVKDFFVKTIFTSAPKLIAHFHANDCFAGQQWDWDHVHFNTLNPAPHSPYADNNSSCVIKITGKYGQLLLTGDIQKSTEMTLVQTYGNQLRSTVLQVPHHGSRTSSSEKLIEAVSPQYAIISAGKYNRYHLPAPSVVTRYRRDNVKLYNTANSGAIIIRFLRDRQVKLTNDYRIQQRPSNLQTSITIR